jgi:hypothetical protein
VTVRIGHSSQVTEMLIRCYLVVPWKDWRIWSISQWKGRRIRSLYEQERLMVKASVEVQQFHVLKAEFEEFSPTARLTTPKRTHKLKNCIFLFVGG